uniref:Pyrin domain-containing protein n=1 Tax=Monopterus albus TaxID=43700 RepID=A0A3Q3IZJ6_MONAL
MSIAAILEVLEDLSKNDFDRFCHRLRDRREVLSVDVEGKNRLEITDLVVSASTKSQAPKVAMEVLRQINCNEMAERLGEFSAASPGCIVLLNGPDLGVSVTEDIKSHHSSLCTQLCQFPPEHEVNLHSRIQNGGCYQVHFAAGPEKGCHCYQKANHQLWPWSSQKETGPEEQSPACLYLKVLYLGKVQL